MKIEYLFLIHILMKLINCNKKLNLAEFDIDLNAPPFERWKGPSLAMKSRKDRTIKVINSESKSSKADIDYMMSIIPLLDYQDFIEEFRGIAFYSGIPFEILFKGILSGELINLCTIIISAYRNSVIMSKNIDWDDDFKAIESYFWCNMKKDGKLIFRGFCSYGWNSPSFGYSPGKFEVAINTRNYTGTFDTLLGEMAKGDRFPAIMQMRKIMMANSYKEALEIITLSTNANSAFIGIAGPRNLEGCIITKYIDTQKVDCVSAIKWHLEITNFDHWVEEDRDDMRIANFTKLIDHQSPDSFNAKESWNMITQFRIADNTTLVSSTYEIRKDQFRFKIWR